MPIAPFVVCVVSEDNVYWEPVIAAFIIAADSNSLYWTGIISPVVTVGLFSRYGSIAVPAPPRLPVTKNVIGLYGKVTIPPTNTKSAFGTTVGTVYAYVVIPTLFIVWLAFVIVYAVPVICVAIYAAESSSLVSVARLPSVTLGSFSKAGSPTAPVPKELALLAPQLDTKNVTSPAVPIEFKSITPPVNW